MRCQGPYFSQIKISPWVYRGLIHFLVTSPERFIGAVLRPHRCSGSPSRSSKQPSPAHIRVVKIGTVTFFITFYFQAGATFWSHCARGTGQAAALGRVTDRTLEDNAAARNTLGCFSQVPATILVTTLHPVASLSVGKPLSCLELGITHRCPTSGPNPSQSARSASTESTTRALRTGKD